tara:strand:+ start:2779 stop:3216 length:438 start_codon:yes stop_codon:yes gene_type:complete
MKSIREFVDFNILLNEFSNKVAQENINLPAKLSYAIYRNINKLASTTKYYEEERIAIVKKYSKLDKNGEPVIKDNAPVMKDMDKANEEYKNLLELDADVDLHTINVDVEDFTKDLEGNHQTLTMLWAIIDVLDANKPIVKELASV